MAQKRIVDLSNKEIVLDGDYLVIDDGVQTYRISTLQILQAYLAKNLDLTGNNTFTGQKHFQISNHPTKRCVVTNPTKTFLPKCRNGQYWL